MASDAAAIGALPDAEAEEMRLSREVETLQKMVDDMRREQQEARIDEAVEAGQVEIVDWALVPGGPVGTGRRRRLLFALLVGLMIGGGGALVLDRLNTAIVRREDAEAMLHVPVIAVIPRLGEPLQASRQAGRCGRLLPRRRAAEPEQGLVTVNEMQSAGSQAYRKLRTHLIFSQGGQPPRTLLVTSAVGVARARPRCAPTWPPPSRSRGCGWCSSTATCGARGCTACSRRRARRG